MICANAAFFMTLILTAPGYESVKIDACFEEKEHCQILKMVLEKRFRETTDKIRLAFKCGRLYHKRTDLSEHEDNGQYEAEDPQR